MNLMIVESPNKIKKLEGFLGDGWKVMASVGHIRDLPQRELGVSQPDFELQYEFIPASTFKGRTFPGGADRVERIRREIGSAQRVYLATDPDREGEAIAWHLKDALGLSEAQYQRITFDAITAEVLRAALDRPRKIDMALVHAQEARRALDRLVGYKVSPLVSDQLGQSLSAGRVQSPAVRLVVEREDAIKAFKRTRHYGAVVEFDGSAWRAEWNTKPHVSEASPYVLDEALAKLAASCRDFRVTHSETTTAREAPPSPFSTSLLLQAASVTLKLDPEVTAKLAQKLFEAGAINYIRTDGANFTDEANADIRALATAKGWPLPDKVRKFKAKAGAQEGHEAIRPTHFDVTDAGDDDGQRALYRLIWQRAVASQLGDAQYKVNTVRLEANAGAQRFEFQAKGRVLVAAGWRGLTAKDSVADDTEGGEAGDAGAVPVLAVGSAKHADSGKVLAKDTKAPARYTKASLIAKLEAEGIGRPSTYPAIMGNVMGKGYLVEDKRFLAPTDIGRALVGALVKAEFAFMNLDFTRSMEADLDEIAEGKQQYRALVGSAYGLLEREIARLGASGALKAAFPCPKCAHGLRRYAPAGKTPYWRCTSTECSTYLDDVDGKPLERKAHACTSCGELSMRRFKRKSGPGYLWACGTEGCNHFMEDKAGVPVEPTEHTCPKCKAAPMRRFQRKDKETGQPKGGYAWFCTGADCKTFLDDDKGKPAKPLHVACPSCERPMRRVKGSNGWFWGCTGYGEGCKTTLEDKNGKPAKLGKPTHRQGVASVQSIVARMPSVLVNRPKR